MKRILHSRFRDFEILDCFELGEIPSVKRFFSRDSALSFLRTFQDDYFAMSALRDLVAERYRCSDIRNLNDGKVLEILAGELAGGGLRITDRRPREIISAGTGFERVAKEVEEPPPAPVIKPEPPKKPRPVKPATYSPQAMTLIEAAKDGTPFCEKCEEAKSAA